jgi:hypothetical protein
VSGSAAGSPTPPQITISRPVHTALWLSRPAIGAGGSCFQPARSGTAVVGVAAGRPPAEDVGLPPPGLVPRPGPVVVDGSALPTVVVLPPAGAVPAGPAPTVPGPPADDPTPGAAGATASVDGGPPASPTVLPVPCVTTGPVATAPRS